jgi:hypothetical protein
VLFSLVWLFAVVKVFMLDGSVAPAATAKADTDLVQQTEKKVGLVKKARPIVLLGSKSSSADVSKEDLKVTKRTFVRHVEPPLLIKSTGSVELPLSTEWQLIRTNPNYKVGKNPNYKEGTLAEAPGSGLVVPASPIIVAGAAAAVGAAAGAVAGDAQVVKPWELKWPPVQPGFVISPTDGTEKMPVTELTVPRFWEAPPGADLNKVGSFVGGYETIFLMIASYRDFQCRETITSAFRKADHPERLYVAAVDQVVEGDIGCLDLEVPCSVDNTQPICVYKDQISVFKMDAQQATGPVTARHIGDRLYRGEYFVMQMDAHCLFVRHWDTQIVNQWRLTGNEMAVLSSYLTDVQGSIDANGDSTRNTRPIMCNSDFEGAMPARYLRHGSQPEDVPTVREMPQLQPFWAAGFSFSRGHFKLRVPYDAYQPMVFQGEEIAIGIRGFTYGYDFYAPRDSVVFHEYAERSQRRKKIPMFWFVYSLGQFFAFLPYTHPRSHPPLALLRENSVAHRGEGQKSLRRGTAVIGMAPDLDPTTWDHSELEKYGLGKVRELSLFYKLFLIDAHKRSAVQLCPFVKSGVMHRNFQKFLRSDGLGIDYAKLQNFDTARYLPNKKADPFS